MPPPGGGFVVAIAGGPTFSCAPDEPVLRAALRAGLPFPYECGTGSCGTCRFEIRDGAFDMAWREAPAWSERDRQRNRMLGCQATPLGPATIAVRLEPARKPPIAPVRRAARLERWRVLTHDIWEFELHAGGVAEFLPGQYALLALPNVPGWRAYSMANLANSAGVWQFIVKRKQGGLAGRALFEAPYVGMPVVLDAPYGHAFLAPGTAAPVLCIAGGSGLSPMVSILRAVLRRQDPSARMATLFYGGRRPADIVDLGRCFDPAPQAAIDYRVVLSNVEDIGPEIWPGARGMVHEAVERAGGAVLATAEIFVAGPPPMVEASVAMLRRRGVPAERIHFDSFY
ncbi:MAG TPA: 2Fe-2S iron-sulfur cluster binding domain-containing protein [Alphaproteobacteria bacterium]|jgi:toluene monooxygenase electron transfer component|nr:2Fe-2S iron-sulfur cluster binding domain-containing protein [Alphaproteobacteria bacterium]